MGIKVLSRARSTRWLKQRDKTSCFKPQVLWGTVIFMRYWHKSFNQDLHLVDRCLGYLVFIHCLHYFVVHTSKFWCPKTTVFLFIYFFITKMNIVWTYINCVTILHNWPMIVELRFKKTSIASGCSVTSKRNLPSWRSCKDSTLSSKRWRQPLTTYS